MTDVRDPNWPKFMFSVEIPDLGVVAFQEITGLDVPPAMVEFRKPKSPRLTPARTPGIAKYANVTMKRGVVVKDDAFVDWYKTIGSTPGKRTTVTIKLLDERGQTAMFWTLKNAFPTKITGGDLSAAGNDVAIDTLEIAHEGLTASNN